MLDLNLEATDENIVNALEDNRFGRSQFLEKLIMVLLSAKKHKVYAIDGAWGTGKTFFVKQLELILNSQNKEIGEEKAIRAREVVEKFLLNFNGEEQKLQGFIPIYYDAWENDFSGNPLMSIVKAIELTNLLEFTKDNGDSSNELNKNSNEDVRDLLKYIYRAGLVLFSGTSVLAGDAISGVQALAVNTIVGPALEGAIEGLSKEENVEGNLKEEITLDALRKNITELLDNIFVNSGKRLVIIVDELDRCRPTFAVTLLEQVKHYFNHPGVQFLFATNLRALESTVKHHYGSEFDGCRYLDRFFDLTFVMPEVDRKDYVEYLGEANHMTSFDKNIMLSIAEQFDLSLRELHRIFEIVDLALARLNIAIDNKRIDSFHMPNRTSPRIYNLCVPILVALNLVDKKKYAEFIKGNESECFISIILRSEWIRTAMAEAMMSSEDSFISDLKDLYEAIFRGESTQKGRIYIAGKDRSTLLNTAGLFFDIVK